jgi:hypothetical protein
MKVLSIPYDEGLLLLSGQQPDEFEADARFLLALKYFELRDRVKTGEDGENVV